MGVTDHDTLNGLDEALAAGEAAGIRVVTGVEVSLRFKRPYFTGTLHYLLYIPYDLLEDKRFRRDAEAILSQGRGGGLVRARVAAINAEFGPNGATPLLTRDLTAEEIEALADNVTRRHFALALSLALYEGQRPLVGVIYDPTRDECFRAAAGQGATVSGPNGTRPLRVSAAAGLVGSLLATGFPYDVHTSPLDNGAYVARFIKRAFGLRRAGSAALDMAYVAAGRLDGYWEFKVNAWDIAAGILLVQEAGGCVTLIDGRPLGFARQMHVVASNGVVHEAMLEVIREVK